MFAVIRTGGKQYRVAANDTLEVERLAGEAGAQIVFSDVLVIGGDEPQLGAPLIGGASVVAEIVEHKRGPKIIVFKKRRRQNSRRKRGHRQDFTLVRIAEILTDDRKPSAKKAAAPKPEAKRPAEAEEATKLFEMPGETPDDLKKITGIGPALEKKLNALGVTRYAQIAGFSPDDMQRVDEALNIKGRVERDDWIGQAKALAEGTKE